jgi:hypothetical protein
MTTPRPGRSISLPSKIFVLLKTGLSPSKTCEIPAKASMLFEGLVLVAALALIAAILLVVLYHLRHA